MKGSRYMPEQSRFKSKTKKMHKKSRTEVSSSQNQDSFCCSVCRNHLDGLVVKASTSTAEHPRFESRLRRDFSGVESDQ